MTINDVILNCMTENNMVNNALLHSGIDVDALACRFFKKVQDEIGKSDMRQSKRITGLPAMIIEKINSGCNSAALAKLALLLATGASDRISVSPSEVFKAAMNRVEANPDAENSGFWLGLAVESLGKIEEETTDDDLPF